MKKSRGYWVAIGIGLGVSIGVATDNLAVWIAIGAAFGGFMASDTPVNCVRKLNGRSQ